MADEALVPDLDQAEAFLSHLTGGSGSGLCFQTFHDTDKGPKDSSLARAYSGPLARYRTALDEMQRRGSGVFVTVNETDGQGRKAANIVALRALFVDFDGPQVRPFAIPPSIEVISARGRHGYWLLHPGELLQAFGPAQRQLSAFYDSDPKIHDVPRVMRLPGFWHLKNPAMPHLVRLEATRPGRYTIAEVLAAHPVEAIAKPVRLRAAVPRMAFTEGNGWPEYSFRVRRAIALLESPNVAPAVSGQGGHDALFAATIPLKMLAIPSDAALELLRDHYNPRCSPAWSDAELEHKVTDVYEKSAFGFGQLLDEEASTKRRQPPRLTPVSSPRPVAVPSSLGPTAAEALRAAVESPVKRLETALAGGRPNEELAELLADLLEPFEREHWISRVAHERRLGKAVVAGEVKSLIRRRRKLQLVPDDGSIPPPRRDRPEIVVEGGKLHTMVDRAELALLATAAVDGSPVFQRGGQLVRVIRAESLTIRGIRRPPGALLITSLEVPYLTKRLTGAIRWLKFDQRAGEYLPTDAPTKVAEVLLASHGEWKAPGLIGTIEAPTLRPDGSILSTPGYDESTGLYFDPGQDAFPTIPESPSRSDAEAALQPLLELLQGFPFVAPVDRSAALSAWFTALVRKSLPSAPLHTFTAPKMRSGKTLLADVGALLATGRPCAVLSQANDAEEERKRLLALLLAGDSVICFDNLERPLGGAPLCQALTQESIQDRVLGSTAMVQAPTSVTFLATGNNLTVEGDLTARTVPCALDPGLERPEERVFDVDLYDFVPRHRGELVAAALTILRAYIVAGRPSVGLKPWGGFDAWSNLVRSAIAWMGLEDPAAGRSRVEELDPVRAGLRTLLQAWREALGPKGVTAAEAVSLSNLAPNDGLRVALAEIASARGGEVTGKSVGHYIKKFVGRIEGGLRFVRLGEERTGVALWSVQATGESAGFAGFAGFDSSNAGKLSQSLQDSLWNSAESSPANPANPAAKMAPHEFTCDQCNSHDSRPNKSGRPICNVCWPSPTPTLNP